MEVPVRLVVAVGSRRGDDAAGLLVADLLRAAGEQGAGGPGAGGPGGGGPGGGGPGGGLDVVELSGDLTRLLDLLAGRPSAVLVDAVRGGGEPGTVHRVDALRAPLPAGLGTTSTHGIRLADAVALGRVLGRLPGRLLLYGIVGARWADGDEPSPAVRAAAARVAAEVLAGV